MSKNDTLLLIIKGMADMRAFTSSQKRIMQAFHDMKRDPRFSDFLGDFLFDTNGDVPYCEDLDDLLQNKHVSGVLGAPNPTWSENQILEYKPEAWRAELTAALGASAADFELLVGELKERLRV